MREGGSIHDGHFHIREHNGVMPGADKAERLKASKAEIEAAFYEHLTGALTREEAAAFAAALDKLYTASKTESRAGFPHFRNTAGGETARGTTD